VKAWDDLVGRALIGTDRTGASAPTEPVTPAVQLDQLLAGTAGDRADDAAILLAQAAAITVFRRAGTVARSIAADAPPLPDAARADELPCCPEAAAHRLQLMLDGAHLELLPEWADRVAARGERIAPAQLPAALERGRQNVALRAHLGGVIGRRGRWLAGCNDRWRWATGVDAGAPLDDVRRAFATGGLDERRHALARWRELDAAGARDALAGTWAADSSTDRASFVEVLATGLTDADEPFLEATLDDRSKVVRSAAAKLLGRLPSSALSQRMAARARLAIGTRAKTLTVTAPDDFTAEMARDGIVEKPPQGVGPRAWWMRQIIASAPLAAWVEAVGAPPAELVTRTIAEGWTDELHRGWVVAAARQEDLEWARALVAALPLEQTGDLIAVLTPTDLQRLVLRHVRAAGMDAALVAVLPSLPAPWSEEVSRPLVDAGADLVKRSTITGGAHANELRPLANTFSQFATAAAIALDPATLANALARFRLVFDDQPGHAVLRRLLDNLQFRYEMLQELT
jgi:hypothetical protein